MTRTRTEAVEATLRLIAADLERWGRPPTCIDEHRDALANATGPIEPALYWGSSHFSGEATLNDHTERVTVEFVCSYQGESDYMISLNGQRVARIGMAHRPLRRVVRIDAWGASHYDWNPKLRTLDEAVWLVLTMMGRRPSWQIETPAAAAA